MNRVVRAVGTDASRLELEEQGADIDFEIESANGPEALITATASTPEQALLTAELVAEDFVASLEEIQSGQGIEPTYYYSTLPLEAPTEPTVLLSSTMRAAIGIFGLGVIATFVLISIAEARRISEEQAADDEARASEDSTEGEARDASVAAEETELGTPSPDPTGRQDQSVSVGETDRPEKTDAVDTVGGTPDTFDEDGTADEGTTAHEDAATPSSRARENGLPLDGSVTVPHKPGGGAPAGAEPRRRRTPPSAGHHPQQEPLGLPAEAPQPVGRDGLRAVPAQAIPSFGSRRLRRTPAFRSRPHPP